MIKTSNEWNINWLDKILSSVIFVLTAFCFYAFFYMFRECLRYLSITYENNLWVLAETEVKFYNIFYAAISLIMAMGPVSRFLVDRPSFRKGSVIERIRVLDDSRVLNWIFIMWAAELGSVLGIFFTASQSFYEFSLYPTYSYLFILFVIVLYLQQWTNYRRLYKSITKKWFLPVTLVFITSSYILGSINLIDYKKLNKKVLAKNPYYQLSISKPQSNNWTFTRNNSSTRQLYLGVPKSNRIENNHQVQYEGAIRVESNTIDSIVDFWKSRYPETQHPGFRFQLNIDKSTPMSVVNKLKDEIEKSKIFKIGYSVVPINTEGEAQLRYQRNIIPANLYNYNYIDSLFPERLKGKEIYNVSHNSIDFVVEDAKFDLINFKNEINRIVESNSDYMFNLKYDESLEYGKFIELYASIYGAIVNKRDEYSKENYDKRYDWNTRQIKREIRKKYPLNIEDSEYQREGRTIANTR